MKEEDQIIKMLNQLQTWIITIASIVVIAYIVVLFYTSRRVYPIKAVPHNNPCTKVALTCSDPVDTFWFGKSGASVSTSDPDTIFIRGIDTVMVKRNCYRKKGDTVFIYRDSVSNE